MYLASASASIILAINSMTAQLNQTETEISTGNAINSSADNAVLWAEATSAQAQAGTWGAVATDIEGVSSPELTTATGSLSTVLTTLNAMQTTLEDLQSGSDPTTGLATLQQYGQTLTNTVADAVSSNGVNILNGSTSTLDLVVGYNHTGGVQTVNFTTSALTGSGSFLQAAQAASSGTATDLTALSASDISSANIATTIANIGQAITNVTNYSASIGAMSSSETTMQDFAQTMQTNLENGADDLIGADLNAASARETALNSQIQLAIQALAISSQSSQLVLKLFQ